MEPLHTLQWLYEMGVDEIIAESPVNRLKSVSPPPQDIRRTQSHQNIRQSPSPAVSPSTPVLGTTESITLAEQVIQGVSDLESLYGILESFSGCPTLKNTAKHTLVYTGNPTPKLLCIGDCPTNENDQNGQVLGGKMQKLLYRMITTMGLNKSDIGYTNRIFWYPPGGRTITQGEAQTCLPFVKKIIEITHPKHILILGNDTAKTILQTPNNISKINGKTTHITIADTQYACTPTFGFNSIFSDGKRKKFVWNALQNIHL